MMLLQHLSRHLPAGATVHQINIPCIGNICYHTN